MRAEGERKRGRLSQKERAYIAKNATSMSYEQIANKLNRTVEVVREAAKLSAPADAVARNEGLEEDKVAIRQELRSSESWKRLKDELTQEELVLFEEEYVKLMSQFKGDVLATEEIQIMQAIKFDILMSRNLRARQKAIIDIKKLETIQEKLLAKFGGNIEALDESDKNFIITLESQLQAAKAAEQDRTSEYVKLQDRHESLMKTLKATRDQRIKQIESSKVSFLGFLKMLAERDKQESEGRQLELMKLATDKEMDRLGRPHKFEDGNEDSPILCSETVDLGPEEVGDGSDPCG